MFFKTIHDIQSSSRFKLLRRPYRFLAFPFTLIFQLGLQAAIIQTPAFPGAEGFGRFTTGGRGGAVVEVINLDDSGPGSLRAALETVGKRTIIFRISGTIALRSELVIKHGEITIAGQTAPGDGICIRNYPLIVEADNVIIRYIRSRLGDESKTQNDALSATFRKQIMIDHCSFSWGMDETLSIRDNENSTVQWCIISESLNHSYHKKGDHGYGGIWGGRGASFHHNLLAHHASRTPRFNGSRYSKRPEKELVDFRNNVIFNWGFNDVYGGEAGNQNVIANFYRSGPATECKDRIADPWDAQGRWYVNDNFVSGYPKITADNWAGGVQGKFSILVKSFKPFDAAPVTTQSAEIAYDLVMRDAGAVLPKRDPIDQRIIHEVETGTATHGGRWGTGSGIIDSQNDAGGWPELMTTAAPTDSDHDGMPDGWERSNGLNPADPADRNGDFNGNGYTNLEDYLNSLTAVKE